MRDVIMRRLTSSELTNNVSNLTGAGVYLTRIILILLLVWWISFIKKYPAPSGAVMSLAKHNKKSTPSFGSVDMGTSQNHNLTSANKANEASLEGPGPFWKNSKTFFATQADFLQNNRGEMTTVKFSTG